MSLTSVSYILFIFGMALLIKYVPKGTHWVVLLLGSYIFYYTWNPVLLPILGTITLLSYFLPLYQQKTGNKLSYLGIILLLAPLVYLKYRVWGQTTSPDLIYLIGVSFYTFTAISYVVDCSRGMIKPITHLGQYASFLSFYPNLLAGPIEKFRFLSPQLAALKPLKKEYIEEAILLIMWGWVKKTVVSSRIAVYTDLAFDHPEICSPFHILGAALVFPAQLYADYTGYFDIAKGSALLMGVRLTANFENKIFYLTRREAWLSWNKTMHAWFRDYFFFPLSRILKGPKYAQFNKICTNCLSGLWHGASFGFFAWGFLQWFFSELKLPGWIQKNPILGYTFTFVTGAFATFWFRVSYSKLPLIYSKITDFQAYDWQLGYDTWLFLRCVLLIAFLELTNRQISDSWYTYYCQANTIRQYSILVVFCILLFTFSRDTDQLFYYFKF